MEAKVGKHSFVSIKNRESISLDGVKNVESFDEGYVSLGTDTGNIYIEGKNMKIISLTEEDGLIVISGVIDGFYYNSEKQKRGILGRLFG